MFTADPTCTVGLQYSILDDAEQTETIKLKLLILTSALLKIINLPSHIVRLPVDVSKIQ